MEFTKALSRLATTKSGNASHEQAAKFQESWQIMILNPYNNSVR